MFGPERSHSWHVKVGVTSAARKAVDQRQEPMRPGCAEKSFLSSEITSRLGRNALHELTQHHMAQIKEVGDSQPLSKSPVASPSSTHKQGTVQMVGDHLPLSRTSVQSPSANPRGGKIDLVGDKVGMSRTPQKGLGSAANIPMSARAVQQSNTVATRGRKK
jgi:hypothetical protein